MGDKRVSFLIVCNVEGLEFFVKLMGTITKSKYFLNTILLSQHYLDPLRYPLRLKSLVPLDKR